MAEKTLPPEVVDMATFEQLVEMDEDEPGFSLGLVENFFEQVDGTLKDMSKSLADKDLEELSRQAHFLKGSAAALGIVKVKRCFEKIQYLGQGKEENGQGSPDPEKALARVGDVLKQVAEHISEARSTFDEYYA